jgi:hypothetical protein
MGPHPFPTIVRELQRIISTEMREQFAAQAGGLPDAVIACVGGGSNAIGSFADWIEVDGVRLIGVEAAGEGVGTGRSAATISEGREAVLHGSRSIVLVDDDGQVLPAHSVSAGLDYPGVGPEHAHLASIGRAEYVSATDEEALRRLPAHLRARGHHPGARARPRGRVGARPRPRDARRGRPGDRDDVGPRRQGRRRGRRGGRLGRRRAAGLRRRRGGRRDGTRPWTATPDRRARGRADDGGAAVSATTGVTAGDVAGADAIQAAFDRARAEDRAALIVYLTAGYPDLATSPACYEAAVEAGADILEIGLPFSDPMMDGPIIQAANQTVLDAGTTIAEQLELVRSLAHLDVPKVVMTYVTIADTRGYAHFADELADAGIAGVILPDLPVAEADDWLAEASRRGLATVFLASSVSTDARLDAIAARRPGGCTRPGCSA